MRLLLPWHIVYPSYVIFVSSSEIVPFLEDVEKEDGVLEFKLFRQKDDPTWILAYEEYRDEEAFEKHRNSQHVDNFVEVLIESVAKDVFRGFWEEIAAIKR